MVSGKKRENKCFAKATIEFAHADTSNIKVVTTKCRPWDGVRRRRRRAAMKKMTVKR